MLVLRRKRNQGIEIKKGGQVLGTILVTKITPENVFLGLEFPDDHVISRDNIKHKKEPEHVDA